jgi:hypothetical protein
MKPRRRRRRAVVGPRRFEIPLAVYSWREGPVTRTVTIGAHCVDESWPWWRPWVPWERRRAFT